MNLNVSEEQLKKDIATYNKSKPELIPFNVKQKEAPYFLQFKTPFYIFNSLVNKYGVINMIGNIAEMTDKEGVAKGGSYLHDLDECGIKEKIIYKGSSPLVGFRAIAEVKYL